MEDFTSYCGILTSNDSMIGVYIMGNSKKNELYNYIERLTLFDSHKNNDDEFEYYRKIYLYVKEYYLTRIKKDAEFLNIERVRLQSKTGKYNSTIKAINSNLILLGLGFLINNVALAFSVSWYSPYEKFYGILFGALLIYTMILYAVLRKMDKDDRLILDLSLQVICDIEKELDKGKYIDVENQNKLHKIEDIEIEEKIKSEKRNVNISFNLSTISSGVVSKLLDKFLLR